MRHGRSVGRFGVVLGVALCWLAAACGSAHAHAVLVGTDPSNESTIERAPDEVRITFNENVTVAFGGVKAFGPDGQRADRGDATVEGDTVRLPLEDAGEGSYAVAWRVVSADGHPVRGASVFHVGAPTGKASRDKAAAASEASGALELAFGVARGGVLLGVLLAAGGVLFGVATGTRTRWTAAFVVVAAVSVAASYVLDAAVTGGFSLLEALRWTVLEEQSGTVYGRGSLARAGALVVLALVLAVSRTVRMPRVVLGLAAVVLAATLSLSGHAIAGEPLWLRLGADMLHSIAAAVWLGGLAQLLVAVRERELSPAAVGRFSQLALASVVALVVTGLYAAYNEVGLSVDGLVGTTYGRLVLIKAVLLGLAMPLAYVNRQRNVPGLGDSGMHEQAAARLGRYVAGELALLVCVIAATAWLIQAIPAKDELRPGFVEKTVELRSGSLQLVLDPAEVGPNELHLYALDKQHQPNARIAELTITASNPERDIDDLDITVQSAGPGHYTTASATLPFAGRWTFTVRAKLGEFEEQRARFDVEIAPASNDTE